MPDHLHYDLAIIGGGAAGVLTAVQALRQARTPLRIVLVEMREQVARGAAYSTDYAEHLLNVPARGMSAFADVPGDFLDDVMLDGHSGDAECAARPREQVGGEFLPRRRYAQYLDTRLRQAQAHSPATLQVLQARVESLQRRDGGDLQLRLGDGGLVHARAAVLAVGNRPRPLPARGAGSLPPETRIEAWDYAAVKSIAAEAEVGIVGSGLSMVDAVLSLAAQGHRGRIHVLSRHAWLPLPHASAAPAGFDVQPLLALPLRRRIGFLRERVREAAAAGLPWQAVMERLRPHGQALWQSLSPADQRRFLRHGVRLWDVHRHRVAAPVHARLAALQASGQLRLHRGRLDLAMMHGRCLRLSARLHDGRDLQLDVDRVINATGVELRVQAMRNPLLTQLLGEGHAQPGAHGIGIATAADGSVLDAYGVAQPWLLALGSLRIGQLWESTAIPELRVQAEDAARRALGLLAAATDSMACDVH